MPSFITKLRWLDWLILVILTGIVGYVVIRVEGTLNYEWRWELIPDYILRYREDRGEWFANLLLQGLFATIRISIYAGILALIFGTVLGIARVSENLTIRLLARTYLELLRNIPPVVIIFIFFFFLSQQLIDALNLNSWSRSIARSDSAPVWEFFFGEMRRFPSLVSGVLVLAMFEAAFVGEIVRAGIQSVPKGQREAARAIGMSRYQEMRFIVMPIALRKVVPPMANQFISLIKDTSIISLISVQELTYKTVELVASTRLIFEAWITTAGFYFVLCFGLSMLFRRLEKSP
ncbi:amino acid ABC transporter permease [Sulfitobacter sp. F26169L]|uniref:amino acid ABC transporter permease n=1 Tax=Sulfitobacter sp. F26169L TaxID=2996015 RepID=UPI002260B0F0|nr:amino acid ABC transporter permease [Sulfitobacter sp. F26169L]MCX7567771.1 amino acid ABC transporter permease [Sulfitobacter sp. F26169L]